MEQVYIIEKSSYDEAKKDYYTSFVRAAFRTFQGALNSIGIDGNLKETREPNKFTTIDGRIKYTIRPVVVLD